jgi:hypothetical protein
MYTSFLLRRNGGTFTLLSVRYTGKMAWRLIIAIAVTAALALGAVAIFGLFAFEGGDRSAPPAHVEPDTPPPAPTAPANP